MLTDLQLGVWGEHYAARLYQKAGCEVLVRNSYNQSGKRLGEIDLICRRQHNLIFIEVKTRVSTRFGLPEEAISRFKKQRLIRSVHWFISKYPEFNSYRQRIDVCAILLLPSAKLAPASNLDKYVKYSKIITNAVELN